MSKLYRRIAISVVLTVVNIVGEHLLDALNQPDKDEEERNPIGFR